jgi:hypothetical protein
MLKMVETFPSAFINPLITPSRLFRRRSRRQPCGFADLFEVRVKFRLMPGSGRGRCLGSLFYQAAVEARRRTRDSGFDFVGH